MKIRTMVLSVAALGLWLGSSTPSQAHVDVTLGPASLQGGISYEFLVDVDHSGGTGTWDGFAGAKSWNEPVNPVGSKGWTHTSSWAALDLKQGGTLTITIDQKTVPGQLVNQFGTIPIGTQFTPAFTLFKGWATGPTTWNPSDPVNGNTEWHTFNTTGNPYDTDPLHWDWAKNQISYIDHEANPLSLNSITRTFTLPAGQYSLAIGGNPADLKLTGLHGFLASANLAPVPIPAAVWLFGTGVIGLIGVARRRMTAK